jgi:transcriptional regulator with XRE-family HTH domain
LTQSRKSCYLSTVFITQGKKRMTLDKIKDALRDRRLDVVSEKTGISATTLSGIRAGRITRPHAATIKVLSEYLKVQE